MMVIILLHLDDHHHPGGDGAAAVTLSAMVGAVTLPRALGSTPRSDELLRDVREAVREHRLLSS
jgi:hypothetical protein